jgi:hypothetical protein
MKTNKLKEHIKQLVREILEEYNIDSISARLRKIWLELGDGDENKLDYIIDEFIKPEEKEYLQNEYEDEWDIELINNITELNEESCSGDAGAYLTPNAFSKKTNNKIATQYGMKLVKPPKKHKSMNENQDKIQKVADFLKQYNFEEKWGTGPKAVDTPVARKQQQFIEDKFGISHAEFSEAWKLAFNTTNESNYDKASVSSDPSIYSQASGYTGGGIKGDDYYKQGITEENIVKTVRRFIPKEFEFPASLLKPIKLDMDEPRAYFKVAAKGDEYILMIDPLVKTSFDEIERGRTSFDKEKKLFALTRYIKEKVPQQIRGLMKKYSQGVKIQSSGFIPLPLVLTKGINEEGQTALFVQNPSSNKDNIKADIGTSMYESLQQIIKEELLNEVTYNKFKNEVKFRTKNEMLHRGIREVKRKLNEVERLIEYVSRMKGELLEDSDGVNYWKNTSKNINEIGETANRLSDKIKNLYE